MKIQTVAASLFVAVGTISTGHYAAMDADTWCLTYISTYLAPVSVPGGSPLSTTRDSDTPTKGGSLEPTFGSDTPTQTTTDTDIQDASASVTSLLFLELLKTSLLSSTGFGSSTLNIDPQSESSAVTLGTTILTLTDEPTISLDPKASTDLTSTSSSIDIIEPAGRAVILQIVVLDNEKRDVNKRATNGFVGNENPDVCTFATTFNLAKDQLFDGGVPIFYSGEDFKELSGQGSPSSDAITTSFKESGQQLVLRNPDLPNGQGSFCQNSKGLIYIVFTTGPSNCVPVNLAVYDVEQCQNGRIVGVDELTSTIGISNSETASPETISSGTAIITSTEGVVNSQSSESVIESTGATEVTTSTEANSGSLDKSTSVTQAESVESGSDTASPETRTTVSTWAVDSSTSLSPIVTTQAVSETSFTDLPALPSTEDDTSTEGGSLSSVTTAGPVAETSATGVSTSLDTTDDTTTEGKSISSSITTERVSEISTAEVGTSSQEASSIVSTESASIINTSIEPEDSTAGSSSPPLSETTSKALADMTSSATTETTEAGTTVTLPALNQTSSTEIAGIEDSTTANANIPTTTEDDAVRDTTTATLESTTNAVTSPCTVVDNPYDATGGGQFFIYCDSDVDTSTTLESVSDISLQACMDSCSLNSDCKGVRHVKSTNLCLLLSFGGALVPNDETDIAFLDQGE